MKVLKQFLIFISFFVFLSTQIVAAEKISIVVGGIGKQIYLPAKLTEALGYFKEQGLNVELIAEQSLSLIHI